MAEIDSPFVLERGVTRSKMAAKEWDMNVRSISMIATTPTSSHFQVSLNCDPGLRYGYVLCSVCNDLIYCQIYTTKRLSSREVLSYDCPASDGTVHVKKSTLCDASAGGHSACIPSQASCIRKRSGKTAGIPTLFMGIQPYSSIYSFWVACGTPTKEDPTKYSTGEIASQILMADQHE